MSRIVHLALLGPSAGSYHREPRHDCHCGEQQLLDRDGICHRCGRFPRALIAELNETRKRTRKRKAGR